MASFLEDNGAFKLSMSIVTVGDIPFCKIGIQRCNVCKAYRFYLDSNR